MSAAAYIAFFLFLAGVVAVTNGRQIAAGVAALTRGVRNHNPGNLRRTADQWQGLTDEQTDPEFFQFTAPFYGIRAMARTLKNYQARHGLHTLEAIIARYAPTRENDTAAYVEHVSELTGIAPDAPFNVAAHLDVLVPAMIAHENAGYRYPPALILQGVNAA